MDIQERDTCKIRTALSGPKKGPLLAGLNICASVKRDLGSGKIDQTLFTKIVF